MQSVTLSVFSPDELKRAHLLLATLVAEMMGRKLEEGDWAKVYCAAKGIPLAGWSNTDIDVMFGNVGVEHKMMCVRSKVSIRDACGTTIMHPAGTRAIRIPEERDPTKAARDILDQYGGLIRRRLALVAALDEFNNGLSDRAATRIRLESEGFSRSAAERRVPKFPIPGAQGFKEPDLRTGWLLWQESLREFLYFEEPMTPPPPEAYWAEWRDTVGSGTRRGSRSLWIFHLETNEKHFSVTTEAGAKVQPYFKVPAVNDRNLYHFVVQGEDCDNGLVRVWLTKLTAELLRRRIGDLTPETIASAVDAARLDDRELHDASTAYGPMAVEILVPSSTYERFRSKLRGVSDEHNFKQLVDLLEDG